LQDKDLHKKILTSVLQTFDILSAQELQTLPPGYRSAQEYTLQGQSQLWL